MIKSAWNLRIEPRPYQSEATLASRVDVQSIALSRRKSERLEYFFCPQNEEVLRAIVENAARFFELIDQRRA